MPDRENGLHDSAGWPALSYGEVGKADTQIMKILDMAHFTEVHDWAGINADGVICKATQGNSFVDPSFVDKIQGAMADGKVVGAYHFYDPRVDPVDQADKFGKTCLLNKVAMLLAVDLEEMSGSDDWEAKTVDQRSAGIFTFLWRLQLHYKGLPFIYMTKNFYETYLKGVDFSAWPLWVADYSAPGGVPRIPSCWKTWTLWQSSDKDKEQGMFGYADLDTFEGDLAGLKSLCCVPV